jgi:hypothetical protein
VSALTEAGQAELRRFGWTLGPDFERRYHTDPWVFNLANAVEAVAGERECLLDTLEKLEVELGKDRPYLLLREALRTILAGYGRPK